MESPPDTPHFLTAIESWCASGSTGYSGPAPAVSRSLWKYIVAAVIVGFSSSIHVPSHGPVPCAVFFSTLSGPGLGSAPS